MIRRCDAGLTAKVVMMAVGTTSAMQAGAATEAPYGSWRSPITAQSLAENAIRMKDVRVVGQTVYWNESRPTEKGRIVLLSQTGSEAMRAVIPGDFNVRTRVHEYGGTSYVATADAVYFSNFSDQRLYELQGQAAPKALTPAGYRYADCIVQPSHDTLICVREDHTAGSDAEQVKNALVSVKRSGDDAGTVLFGGSDFVAYPRLSQDGKHLAWVAWDHPNMPWDTTTLYVAELSAEGLKNVRAVAGGSQESVLEPQWDQDGTLYFISDRKDFWNLYSWREGRVRPVLTKAAEFATPLWSLGASNYVLTGDGSAVVRYGIDLIDHLAVLDLKRGTLRDIPLPYVGYDSIQLRGKDHAVMIATAADQMPALIEVDLRTGKARQLRQPVKTSLEDGLISRAEVVDFPTAGGRVAHAFYYPPHNSDFTAPEDELPPLIVKVHGGPTGASTSDFNPGILYWTSRGFAVADVNYGGSSGYGRAYRERLNTQWGVTDVQDVVAAAQYLGKQGKADPKRLIIRGGSAGGYTVLGALSQTDVFRTGADYYGVSDLAALARDTHKFESRYLDGLVAPYPAGKAVYEARSPLSHLAGFKAPLLVLQGSEDPIVPPNQAHMIVDALKSRGSPVAYLEFAGESHGFRKAENIVRATEAELYFYGQVLGFTPADKLPAVKIENAAQLKK